jgi:hypothetical protein
MPIIDKQLNELLLQSLETEIGGVQIYTAAVGCAVNPDLKEEWEKYLDQTRRHERLLREACEAIGLDADMETPGRQVVRHLGNSLVAAIKMAKDNGGPPEAAQLVAAECVVLAETKDHMDWSLLGKMLPELDDERKAVLKQAWEEVEDQEDEHLYHTRGWARELWLESLGLPAVLPPPEEVRHEVTAAGAANAEKHRDAMLASQHKH